MPCTPGSLVGQQSPPIDCPTVKVYPSTNLVDLQQVKVNGFDFTPGAQIATVECSSQVTLSNINLCDLSTLIYTSADSTGVFHLPRFVRRILTVNNGSGPQQFDCASAPNACLMGAANIASPGYAESNAALLSFNPNVPPKTPTIFAVPSRDLVDHQVIALYGSGFYPYSGTTIQECEGGIPPSYSTCDFSTQVYPIAGGSGAFTIKWPVERLLYVQSGTIDCAVYAGACQVVAGGVYNGSSNPATAPLQFNRKVPPKVQAVTATPSTGLKDHQLVQVSGTGYTPGATVAVIQCQAGAPPQNCDYNTIGSAIPGYNGAFLMTYPVHRILSLFGGPFDCASAPNACVIQAANEARFQEMSTSAVSFNPKYPPVVAKLTVTPSTGLLDNEAVKVAGTGYTPYSDVAIQQCPNQPAGPQPPPFYCYPYPYPGSGVVTAQASATGTFSVTLFVHRLIRTQAGLYSCATKPGACIVIGQGFSGGFDTASQPISFK